MGQESQKVVGESPSKEQKEFTRKHISSRTRATYTNIESKETNTHALSHIHTHVYIHTYIQTHTHMHELIHTHKHTHTQMTAANI